MEKVSIGDKEYTVKEIKYHQIASAGKVGEEEAAKRMMIMATSMTEEEYNDLSLKDGLELQKVINKVNGLTDFQMPQTSQTS